MQTSMTNQSQILKTQYSILFLISLVHLLNDTFQAIIPAMLPILRDSMTLTFFQIGLISFTLNITASLMQPVIGYYSDKRPTPILLPIGVGFSFIGLLGIGLAPNYGIILFSVLLVGIGSAVFHPEAARVAYLAAGPRRGLAQSIYQVGGNGGQSLAPLISALVFVPFGQFGAVWFAIPAAIGIYIQTHVARWYRVAAAEQKRKAQANKERTIPAHRKKQVVIAISLLIGVVFARSWYHAGVTNYYPFLLIDHFGFTYPRAQAYLFIFLLAGAVGTFFGGPLSDRYGKRNMLIFSMLGAAPLAIIMPYVTEPWSYIVVALNGFIILSSFSVIVVYAQELLPGRIGLVSGLVIGLAFGMGAIGAAVIGILADLFSIREIMTLISFLPLFGLLAFYLPSDEKIRDWNEQSE